MTRPHRSVLNSGPMNPKPDQEETAELSENGGHMTHVGKAAFKFARRLLRLNCKYGWNAEKDLDPS